MEPDNNLSNSLFEFEAKQKIWANWCRLEPQEPNNLEGQLSSLLQRDLEFRIIRLARDQGNLVLQNPIVDRFNTRGHIALQLAGIRRMVETYDPIRDKQKQYGVISLTRLISELRDALPLMTRYNFVCRGGLEYAPSLPDTPLASEDNASEGSTMYGILRVEDGPLRRWMANQRRHQVFDLLSGVKAVRSPEDLLDSRLLDLAQAALKSNKIADLVQQGNKYLLHAADKESRRDAPPSPALFQELEDVHKILVRVESFLVDFVVIPEVARDTTLLISPPLFRELEAQASPGRLYSWWMELAQERNQWRLTEAQIRNRDAFA